MDQVERERPKPFINICRQPYGIWVDTASPIPQRQLMASVLNSSIMVRFNFDWPSFAAEGGVQGIVASHHIDLTNFGDERGRGIGLIDGLYTWGAYTEEPARFKDVFDFYDKLIRKIFDGENGTNVMEGIYSTPEETLLMLNGVLSEVGGSDFPQKVMQKILSIPPDQRVYLRGLTDEDIERIFVQPTLYEVREFDPPA